MRYRFTAQYVAAIIGATCLSAGAAAAQTTLTLSADVVAPGQSLTATIAGPPGQHFALIGSSVDSGMSYGGIGLGVGADFVILAQGALDGTGMATVAVRPPFRGTVLDRYYLQAATSPSPSFLPLAVSSPRVVRNGELVVSGGGPAGPAGPAGPTGATGVQGPPGDAGTAGATGAAGATGPAGIGGPPGATGPAGPAGGIGAAGPQGIAGATGPAGPAGTDGAPGAIGATGPLGATGPQGAQGIAGVTGPMGPTGANGATGPAGATGATGPQGTQGIVGSVGPTGDKGPIGDMGPAGPTGATGPQGLRGIDGPAGAPGVVVTNAAGAYDFTNVNGFVAAGLPNTGALAASGAGPRMVWYPRKGAFRAGTANTTEWDDANIGVGSVAMGWSVRASGDSSIAFGSTATASGYASIAMTGGIASGNGSLAIGSSAIASGVQSRVMATGSTASGEGSTAIGTFLTASGNSSTAIGYNLVASGYQSIAMGSSASTNAHFGSFVYGDTSTTDFVSATAPNQFKVRAAGGTIFYSSANTNNGSGVSLAPGGGSWASLSDVRMKANFRDLDGEEVLAKLARIPIREWNYISQDAAIRHVGPTAQDFHAAFGLGDNDRTISTLDPDGISLRAIQALDARTQRLLEENAALKAELAALREAIAGLKQRR